MYYVCTIEHVYKLNKRNSRSLHRSEAMLKESEKVSYIAVAVRGLKLAPQKGSLRYFVQCSGNAVGGNGCSRLEANVKKKKTTKKSKQGNYVLKVNL